MPFIPRHRTCCLPAPSPFADVGLYAIPGLNIDSNRSSNTIADNNYMDDVGLYAKGQSWLNNKHIMGRAVGFLPSVGMVRGLDVALPANRRDCIQVL